jgi:hypothetical protein
MEERKPSWLYRILPPFLKRTKRELLPEIGIDSSDEQVQQLCREYAQFLGPQLSEPRILEELSNPLRQKMDRICAIIQDIFDEQDQIKQAHDAFSDSHYQTIEQEIYSYETYKETIRELIASLVAFHNGNIQLLCEKNKMPPRFAEESDLVFDDVSVNRIFKEIKICFHDEAKLEWLEQLRSELMEGWEANKAFYYQSISDKVVEGFFEGLALGFSLFFKDKTLTQKEEELNEFGKKYHDFIQTIQDNHKQFDKRISQPLNRILQNILKEAVQKMERTLELIKARHGKIRKIRYILN